MKKIQTIIHKNIGTIWETLSNNGTVATTYTSTFFRRQSGKLTEIGHELQGPGTRLLCLAICSFLPKNLRSEVLS